jgi:uncharacterized membrane protein YfcA
MWKSPVFRAWYVVAMCLWCALFSRLDSVAFFLSHWYYAAMMVLGAFVAGFTPEGGGAVAFPVLNVFLHVDRTLARDFSLMIQSVGMTSASVFILSHAETRLSDYKTLLLQVPICFAGFVVGMLTLQAMPVFVIQALFVSLSATFVIAYYFSDHRGTRTTLDASSPVDRGTLVVVLFVGGMVTSLFGTGADILVYVLLVTRLGMVPKNATRIVVVLQAAMSLLGYGYRAVVDQGLTVYQVQTWLCAAPVVLFMAPFGTYALSRLHVNWMLRGIIALNVFQLLYFNLSEPAPEKTVASAIFTVILGATFYVLLKRLGERARAGEVAAA